MRQKKAKKINTTISCQSFAAVWLFSLDVQQLLQVFEEKNWKVYIVFKQDDMKLEHDEVQY